MRGNFMLMRRRIGLVTYIFYPVIIALAIILMAFEPDRWQLPLLIIIFLAMRPVLVYRNMLQSSRQPHNKSANHIVSFEIDDNCITEKIEGGANTTLDWNTIDKAIKGKDFYLIVGSHENPFYIPESSFATNEELDRFKAILESKYLVEK